MGALSMMIYFQMAMKMQPGRILTMPTPIKTSLPYMFDWAEPEYHVGFCSRLPVINYDMPAIQLRYPLALADQRPVFWSTNPGTLIF